MRTLKRWMVRRLLRDWPRRKIRTLVSRELEDLTCRGLFEGMHYIDRAIGSEYFPKLLGTYELELVPLFKRLMRQEFDLFVDIGAAEGYYAVGIALKTRWPVLAFEANPGTPLPDLAALNGVSERIELRGACDLGDLADAIRPRRNPLLLVDVEGAELALLDPRFIPELRRYSVIVEVHDCFIPGIGERLKQRFETSHRIERIDCRARVFPDFPIKLPRLPFDPQVYTLPYLDERRPAGMYWFFMEPLNPSTP